MSVGVLKPLSGSGDLSAPSISLNKELTTKVASLQSLAWSSANSTKGEETGGPPSFGLLKHAHFPESCVPCDTMFFLLEFGLSAPRQCSNLGEHSNQLIA